MDHQTPARSFAEEVQRRNHYYRSIGKSVDDSDICKLPMDVLKQRYPYIKSPQLSFAILRACLERIILSEHFMDFLQFAKTISQRVRYLSDDFERDLVWVYRKEYQARVANGSFFVERGVLKVIPQ